MTPSPAAESALAERAPFEIWPRWPGGSFARPQFTPGPVPSDVVGTRIKRPERLETDIGRKVASRDESARGRG